ncbi:DUF4837 family protein [Mesonia aestuariivivens]|uniref:DUF4837 family protein n=1 Tax=Mesonia aestuariivivens TaxID=2796128 RepID=A0ABS6W111_9FLAO|nr:DUF4837 family protein [Mesonia aestuariivivens]MBW2961542.1 DUF4837 family protein [Mesonia aestuariivivens]
MKKVVFLFFTLVSLVACKDSNKKNQKILSESSGRLNSISIVINNQLWKGEVGENLRAKLAAPIDGLPQQEPLFSLNQIPPKAFSGFVARNRTFLYIKKSQQAKFEVVKDTLAKPQTGIYVYGSTPSELNKVINEHTDSIIQTFKNTELKEQQRRISHSLKSDEKLKESLGVRLKFPTAYRYAKNEDDFFWIRKDIKHGSMEILVYEVPMQVIDKDTNVIGNIIKMRDSIGNQHVPGPNEGSYLITEEAYAPYLFESKIDGKFAYETKGTWEVKGAFMAGPFINYAVRDEKNNRYVILEGFVFKPSNAKRDHIFELESILKSAKIE